MGPLNALALPSKDAWWGRLDTRSAWNSPTRRIGSPSRRIDYDSRRRQVHLRYSRRQAHIQQHDNLCHTIHSRSSRVCCVRCWRHRPFHRVRELIRHISTCLPWNGTSCRRHQPNHWTHSRLIGAALTIVLVGFVLIFVAEILVIVACFSLPDQPPTPPSGTASAPMTTTG